MPPKVLRHCSICKGWGAMYVVQDDALGKLILCHKCWSERQAKQQAAKASLPETKKDPAEGQPPDPDL